MTSLLRQRERSLYLIQEAPFIGSARRALEDAVRAYVQALRDHDAVYGSPDVEEATDSIMESVDNNRLLHVKDFVLEWLQS